jgi:hypothetical protein
VSVYGSELGALNGIVCRVSWMCPHSCISELGCVLIAVGCFNKEWCLPMGEFSWDAFN